MSSDNCHIMCKFTLGNLSWLSFSSLSRDSCRSCSSVIPQKLCCCQNNSRIMKSFWRKNIEPIKLFISLRSRSDEIVSKIENESHNLLSTHEQKAFYHFLELGSIKKLSHLDFYGRSAHNKKKFILDHIEKARNRVQFEMSSTRESRCEERAKDLV